jgi:hypothetical protein
MSTNCILTNDVILSAVGALVGIYTTFASIVVRYKRLYLVAQAFRAKVKVFSTVA